MLDDATEIHRRAVEREDPGERSEAGEPEPYSAEDVAEEVTWYEIAEEPGADGTGEVRRSLIKYVPGAAIRVRVRMTEEARQAELEEAERTAPVVDEVEEDGDGVVPAVETAEPELEGTRERSAEEEEETAPVLEGKARQEIAAADDGAAPERNQAEAKETAAVVETTEREDVVAALGTDEPEPDAVRQGLKEAVPESGSAKQPVEAEEEGDEQPKAAAREGGSAKEPAKVEPAKEEEPEVGALAGTGSGPANGTEAAGGVPDRPDAGEPSKAWEAWVSAFEERFVAAFEKQMKTLVGVNKEAKDLVIDAVQQRTGELVEKVRILDKEEVGRLSQAAQALEEHLRVAKGDENRRRDIRASIAARWYKWPVRGLVAAGAVALLLAGAAGQARWGLIDGFGVADVATNAWRHIVWNEHGWKIAKCMKTADDRRPKAVCSVTARVK